MADGVKVGKIIAELDLDTSKFVKKSQKVKDDSAKEMEKLNRQLQKDADKTAKIAQKSLKEMEKAAERARKEFKRAVESISKSFVILGGAILATLGLAIKKTADYGEQVFETSQKIGVSVENLTAWGYAASQTGASAEDLETGLGILSQKIVDASNGVQGSAKAFKALGIEVTDSNGQTKTAEQIFVELANAMQRTQNVTERVAIAKDLLGRSGANLVPILASGKEGLETWRKEAESLGVVLDTKTAKASDTFNDSIVTLKTSMLGLLTASLGPLIPKLTEFVQSVTQIVQKVGAWAKKHPELTETLAIGAGVLGSLLTTLGLLGLLIPKLITGFKMLKLVLIPVLGPAGLFIAGVAAILLFKREGETLFQFIERIGNGFKVMGLDLKIFFLQAKNVITESLLGIIHGYNNTIGRLTGEIDTSNLDEAIGETKANIVLAQREMEKLLDMIDASGKFRITGLPKTEPTPGTPEPVPTGDTGDAIDRLMAKEQAKIDKNGSIQFRRPGADINPVQTDLEKIMNPIPAGIKSISDTMITEVPDISEQVDKGIIHPLTNTMLALDNLKMTAKGAWESFKVGIGQALAATVSGATSFGKAIKGMAKQVIEGLSAEAMVQAVMELAKGFGALAVKDFSGAKDHFLAAALYGSVGTVAGLAARALTPKQAGGGGGAMAGTGFTPATESFNQTASQKTQLEVNVHVSEFRTKDQYWLDVVDGINQAVAEHGVKINVAPA